MCCYKVQETQVLYNYDARLLSFHDTQEKRSRLLHQFYTRSHSISLCFYDEYLVMHADSVTLTPAPLVVRRGGGGRGVLGIRWRASDSEGQLPS